MMHALTLKTLEGLNGRWQHARPIASRDLPSRHAIQAKVNRMRKQRDDWSPSRGNTNKAWITGWRVGPNEEFRYRIEELYDELKVGFSIQEKADAEITIYCYSDASDVALGRTTAYKRDVCECAVPRARKINGQELHAEYTCRSSHVMVQQGSSPARGSPGSAGARGRWRAGTSLPSKCAPCTSTSSGASSWRTDGPRISWPGSTTKRATHNSALC